MASSNLLMSPPPPNAASQLLTVATLGIAGCFFIAAAYKTIFPLGLPFSTPFSSTSPEESTSTSRQTKAEQDGKEDDPPLPAPKPPSASAVRVTYSTNRSEMTTHHHSAGAQDERPTIRAGALLRLIDVVAGVSARRHAGNSCVTVSIDAVLFLSPVFVGELLHLDASVNRAFGSSMEIGVRIEKEDMGSGRRMYVAHSYLSFVALPRAVVTPGSADDNRGVFSLKPALGVRIGGSSNSSGEDRDVARPKRVKLAPIAPTTMLEARRHLLAGRRRETRTRAAKAAASTDTSQSGVSAALRDEVRYMLPLSASEAQNGSRPGTSNAEASSAEVQRVEMLELELVARAMAMSDPSVRVEPGQTQEQDATVIVNLPGDEPIIHTLTEVRECATRLGLHLPLDDNDNQTRSPLALEGAQSVPTWTDWRRRMSMVELEPVDSVEEIPVEMTLVQSLNLVFPQHANSVSVLFGGQLAEWLEETALLSARHLKPGPWHTVAMDGLPFKQGVAIGEVMTCYAIVTDLWIPSSQSNSHSHSPLAEVLVIAEAEAPDGSRRVTNEALFTLRSEGVVAQSAGRRVKRVRFRPGSELERFAQDAPKRRQQRLEMGDLLVRLYK
ncbi:hypothetical protein A4X06_0g2871 [Tilletia controversa]|uniref:HotDog ACOT-type domain-containing protein n=1 Tax=Tilletia controversa TaxID=13291 RepID=A0A8X7MVM5_9BASI|nr:hypothetical protein CF328_g4638 [Tilletia controversa]KAE8250957.1 hypothetical protein A4X06_0g2871 [Tilletia controversa]